jgi:hypothetical protein
MRRLLFILLGIALLWGALTWYVERPGPYVSEDFGPTRTAWPVLIVFDPDPFYDLDHQVCTALAEALAEQGVEVQVRSVRAAEGMEDQFFALRIFVANTYNWAPDRAVARYINGHLDLEQARVVAITLGAGSTARAHRLHQEALRAKGASIIAERELWLLRPNDDARVDEPNVQVTTDIARALGAELARRIAADA